MAEERNMLSEKTIYWVAVAVLVFGVTHSAVNRHAACLRARMMAERMSATVPPQNVTAELPEPPPVPDNNLY